MVRGRTKRTRRIAIAIGAVSVAAAAAITVALIDRPQPVAHVRAIGSIVPASPPPTTSARAASAPATRPVATYPVATTVPPAPAPSRVTIASLGVDAPIVTVGLEPGTNNLQIPDIDHVGWYGLGPSPGQPGSSVLVGHVDGNGRPGVFWRLGRLEPGDDIVVTFAGRPDRTFRVVGRRQVPKAELPPDLFSRAGPPRLALITCGGAFNRATRHYADNVVIVAEPRGA
jgi:sortase (surface protein transpeptidase)